MHAAREKKSRIKFSRRGLPEAQRLRRLTPRHLREVHAAVGGMEEPLRPETQPQITFVPRCRRQHRSLPAATAEAPAKAFRGRERRACLSEPRGNIGAGEELSRARVIGVETRGIDGVGDNAKAGGQPRTWN